jgi:hypothetical protein
MFTPTWNIVNSYYSECKYDMEGNQGSVGLTVSVAYVNLLARFPAFILRLDRLFRRLIRRDLAERFLEALFVYVTPELAGGFEKAIKLILIRLLPVIHGFRSFPAQLCSSSLSSVTRFGIFELCGFDYDFISVDRVSHFDIWLVDGISSVINE